MKLFGTSQRKPNKWEYNGEFHIHEAFIVSLYVIVRKKLKPTIYSQIKGNGHGSAVTILSFLEP